MEKIEIKICVFFLTKSFFIYLFILVGGDQIGFKHLKVMKIKRVRPMNLVSPKSWASLNELWTKYKEMGLRIRSVWEHTQWHIYILKKPV